MKRAARLRRAAAVAREAAGRGAATALRHWKRGVAAERKRDGSIVTAADRDAEAAILATIRRAFPGDDVLAEEGGSVDRGRARRWIVDPLDGTAGFARGGRMWGPLVALEEDGVVVAAATSIPLLGVSYWAARGGGTRRNGRRVRLAACRSLDAAVVSLGGFRRFLDGRGGAPVRALLRRAAGVRAYGDVAACAMLLDGAADVWLESGVKSWDVAAPSLLVEEAGGRATDFRGGDPVAAGEAACAHASLHRALIDALSR